MPTPTDSSSPLTQADKPQQEQIDAIMAKLLARYRKLVALHVEKEWQLDRNRQYDSTAQDEEMAAIAAEIGQIDTELFDVLKQEAKDEQSQQRWRALLEKDGGRKEKHE